MDSSWTQFVLLFPGAGVELAGVVGWLALADRDYQYRYDGTEDRFPWAEGNLGYYDSLSPEERAVVDRAMAGETPWLESRANPRTFGPTGVGLLGPGSGVDRETRNLPTSRAGTRGMNRLPSVDERTWRLAPHAHVIVHETADGNEFITVYDCGAAQKPPSAQVIGNLVRVRARHETTRQPTGYIAKLREPVVLERQDEDHWLIWAVDRDERRA